MKVLGIRLVYFFIRTSRNDAYDVVYENAREECLLTETTLNHILDAIERGELVPIFQHGWMQGDKSSDSIEFVLDATDDFEMFEPEVIPHDYVKRKTLVRFYWVCRQIILGRDILNYKRSKFKEGKWQHVYNEELFKETV